MNYPRFQPGEAVVPRGKRSSRVVVRVERIAGGYEYLLHGPKNREERAWEHNLQPAA